jgi:hypothetical protein
MTPGEGTKGKYTKYRAGNQGGDGVQVSVINAMMCVTMVTGVRHYEQPGDLEAGEGAHVTNMNMINQQLISSTNPTLLQFLFNRSQKRKEK